jgi:hypothetical protein
MANTILLKSGRDGEPLPKEAKADAAITPGHLIERTSTGVKKHASAGGMAYGCFAIEDSLQGNEIGDDYATGSRVRWIHAGPGDEVQAWLAQGETVAVGDGLESNGDGTLRKSSEEGSELPGSITAIALEALDLSTSGDSATRLKIEVI